MSKFFPNSWDFVDIGLHVLATLIAAAVVAAVWWILKGSPEINSGFGFGMLIFWFVRELWQHDWKLKNMGGQSHAEWIAPGIAGFIVAALI